MGLFSRAADTFYAFRFLRLLTTPWEKTGAFKAGILDANGKLIKRPQTSEEKSVYNYFHRLVFNIKRMLNKVPFGKTTIASYLAALFLLKEHTSISDNALREALQHEFEFDLSLTELSENTWYKTDDGKLRAGSYILKCDVPLPKTGEMLALRNSHVFAQHDTEPYGKIFGIPFYEVYHPKTNQNVYITQGNLVQ